MRRCQEVRVASDGGVTRLSDIAVAPSRYGPDEARLLDVVAELPAQIRDVPVDEVAAELAVDAPDVVQKLLPTHRFSGVRRQDVEQRFLDRGQLELAIVRAQAL